MSGKANVVSQTRADAAAPTRADRRGARRAATRTEITAAAWGLVREQGLAGLSMRDLGERVGMRAQSLYGYFASKHEIYDALFREGYEAFIDATGGLGAPDEHEDRVAYAKAAAHLYFSFCMADPTRYQLLFQRTIPGFEPSEESWAIAIEAWDRSLAMLAAIGITDPADVDIWTAVLTGLTSQQLSNDPGGDRWERLVDRTVEILLAGLTGHG